ncbi:WRKY transcription factor 19 [Phytophthora cinnamomi]|uniref:WRKY transcription factor 19 n=1 Tax=Phytophthora cinnamomi TaxID=4785 RepID=UPI0035599538|nr:WRKY transcription factor 19 [Phytophthora cinnamomi]
MEWNNSRFQLPSSQSPFLQRPARPRYWYYNNNDDDEDEETREIPQHDVIFRPSRFGSDGVLLPPPPSIPSLKLESSSAHNGSNNCDNGSMLLQSFSSLGMPQLEESTEFQPFFPSQSSGFSGSAFLQPSQQQPPTLPELQQQPSEQFSTPQFGQYPSVMTSYYAPAMPLTPPPPVLQSTIRPSADYFPESIPTLHSVHSPVPSIFGQYLQQQPPAPEFEERGDNFDDEMPRDASPVMFTAAMPATPTNTTISAETPLTLLPGGYPAHDMPSDNSPLEYSAAEPMHDAKKRGGGRLTAPFTSMTTVQEPKFSPDKRKLCCVEGCKSQARAFNRCKRHGGSKRCSSPGCTKSVQSRGLCIRHGGGSRCQEPGCSRASQSHGRCKMHGGGRPCIVAGCEKKAHLKRLCRKHGGGAKCCVTGCDKWAQRQGMCMTHSKVVATQPSGIGLIGDGFLDSRKPSPAPSASSSPSLQFFTDNMPV